MDYARALVEHPKWRWEPGMGASWWQDAMVGWLPVVVADADGPIVRISYEDKSFMLSARDGSLSDLLPALERPATKGWLLHMLREATGDQRAQTATRGNLFTGDIVWRCSAGSHLGVDGHATEGEALAAALLAVWGQAA